MGRLTTNNLVVYETYGVILRRHRQHRCLRQDELANKVGVSQGLISKIEQGLLVPKLNIAMALNRAVDIHWTDIANRDLDTLFPSTAE